VSEPEEVEVSKEEETEGESEDEDEVIDETACPRCGGKVPITSTERPLSIKCPSCGKKGRLLS
jgi:DNA-directed RNA polymerase subunit RPC12/RpoP